MSPAQHAHRGVRQLHWWIDKDASTAVGSCATLSATRPSSSLHPHLVIINANSCSFPNASGGSICSVPTQCQAFAVPAQIQLMTMLVKLEEVGSAQVRWYEHVDTRWVIRQAAV